MTFDDILTLFRNSSGGMFIGVLFIAYELYNRTKSDRTSRKADEQEVAGSGSLISQLNTSLQNAINLQQCERTRADEMSAKVSDLSVKVGALEAALRHSEEHRTTLLAEVTKLSTTIEQLIIENRNKDKSITELVGLNRKLLRAMGTDHPADAETTEGEQA